MDIPELKKSLRQAVRSDLRRDFAGESGSDFRASAERKLADVLEAWFHEKYRQGHRSFWAFWPTLPEEPDFRELLKKWMAEGVEIGLPRLNWADRILEFHKINDPDRDLVFDSRGLAEPRPELPPFVPGEVSLVLVPGLAFDLTGARLGRGAGFYDRTLARLGESAETVGIGFDVQVVERVPTDVWDRKVGWLATPEAGLRRCRDED